MDPKLYGTDQNDGQSIMQGGGMAGIDGQNGEGAQRIRTLTSPGDTVDDD